MTVAACALGPDDGRDRMERWRRLTEGARPVARRMGAVLEVTYPPGAGVAEELESLVAAERQCCGFVGWDVSRAGVGLLLHIAADPERPGDIEPFAVLFGAEPNDG
ncbi:MAG TPA: hypothetical protein VG412_10465 [Acidimicrobiales bacterium]|nr:hypothetical protein [Acidimicrobiales bacterium]